MSKRKLQFGALIRVSSEKQERQGESLRTQRTDCQRDVDAMNGAVAEWYGGQEHAMPGYERKELNRLLADAKLGRFDAVIVNHTDRWSRDDKKCREALDVLRECGIRFFVGTTEFDLFDEDDDFRLGIDSLIAKRNVRIQNRKSINNRIHRARRGVPTSGKMPYGRDYNKKTGEWKIFPDKHREIKTIARRYIGGEPMKLLATEYGHNHSSLHKILTQRCGPKWVIEFHNDTLNIHEQVEMDIPRLLDDQTIAAIHKRAAANKTFTRGQKTREYLLSRTIFCAHCHQALTPQTNSRGQRHYRHRGKRPCNRQGTKIYVNADDIELVTIRHLFECFGNEAAVKRAMNEAVPNRKELAALAEQMDDAAAALTKTKEAKTRIISKIGDKLITDEEAEPTLASLREREVAQQAAVDRLRAQVGERPDAATVAARAAEITQCFARVSAKLSARVRHAKHALDEMTFEDRRALVESVFGGKMPDGRRMGVYIEWIDGQEVHRRKKWRYRVVGQFINDEAALGESWQGAVPMTPEQMDARFVFDNPDLENPVYGPRGQIVKTRGTPRAGGTHACH